MKYTKSNLRNNQKPLLRRLQRIVDKQNEKKEETKPEIKTDNLKVVYRNRVAIFEKEKEDLFSILPNIKKRKTRLGLYNKRGNMEW